MPTPPTKRPRLPFSPSSNNHHQQLQQRQLVLNNNITTATKNNNNNSCHIPQTPTPSANVTNQEENVKEQEEEDSFTDANHDLDDLDTETKLAILSSLFPLLTQEDLLEVLITSDGSLDVARGVLGRRFDNSSGLGLGMRGQESRNPVGGGEKYPMLKRKYVSSTTQASLMSYLDMSSSTITSTSIGTDTTGVGAGTSITTNPSMPKPQKGKPLLLYSPEHVAALTPCALITKFLPSEMANELLLELLKEAETFPKKGSEATRFRLFEREVWSRHTSGFYVRGGGNGNVEEEEEDTQVWYTYSGLKEGKMRTFTEKMKVVTEMVERKVREVIKERWERELQESGDEASKEGILHATGRRKYESPYPWSTNAAIVNCYDGGGETVGWHADQVTYLGPMATIASVSLGVGREFGLKKEGGGQDESGGGGIIKVWLPHNSLLIMEAGTQEEWKHW